MYSVELFDLIIFFLFKKKTLANLILLTFIPVRLFGSNCSSPMQDVVNNICDDEDIKAVSFVGSNTVSESSDLSISLFVVQFLHQ